MLREPVLLNLFLLILIKSFLQKMSYNTVIKEPNQVALIERIWYLVASMSHHSTLNIILEGVQERAGFAEKIDEAFLKSCQYLSPLEKICVDGLSREQRCLGDDEYDGFRPVVSYEEDYEQILIETRENRVEIGFEKDWSSGDPDIVITVKLQPPKKKYVRKKRKLVPVENRAEKLLEFAAIDWTSGITQEMMQSYADGSEDALIQKRLKMGVWDNLSDLHGSSKLEEFFVKYPRFKPKRCTELVDENENG